MADRRNAGLRFITKTHQMNRILVLTLLSVWVGSAQAFSSCRTNNRRQISVAAWPSTSSVVLNLAVSNKEEVAAASVARSDRWMSMYEQYCKYTINNNESPPGRSKLGRWVCYQRRQYQKYQRGEAHSLDENKLKLLKQANFIFDAREQRWLQKYELLLDYQKENGHTLVPIAHDKLGTWVVAQRSNYKAHLRDTSSSAFTQDRIDMLNAVDFSWDMQGEARFREKILEASASREQTGTDGPIGKWRAGMKSRYKKYCLGKDGHNLKDYEIALLEQELGFCYATAVPPSPHDREDVSWAERFGQLLEFSAKYGHTIVPQSCTEYPKLGQWVHNVRYRYNNIDSGTATEEIQERIQSLEEAGFIWDVQEYKWNLKFDLLVEYHEQFGHADFPRTHPTLGSWTDRQRRQYVKLQRNETSQLTEHRVAALNRLDFDWKPSVAIGRENEERFQKRLKEYQEHSLSAKPMPVALVRWVDRHRHKYRNWLRGLVELPENQRIALEETGLVSDIVKTCV